VPVTQAVEDQHDQFPDRGDDTDVATAPRADLVADLAQAGVRGQPLHGLDRGPADQPGHCGVVVALLPTDDAPASTLEIRPDGVTLTPDESGTVQVRGPVESLVRLVYGRLDPNRRPHDHLDVRGELRLETLTTLFPGY
jgi:hypothetical protein